jgi:hypothetical protein
VVAPTGPGGMVLRWLLTLGAQVVFPATPTAVPLWAAIMGVAVSVGLGLDPAEALRYE